MALGEIITSMYESNIQRYSDEFFALKVITDIRLGFYARSLKKYITIGEAVSFLSGYSFVQILPTRILALPISAPAEVSFYKSAAPSYMLGRVTDDMADGDLDPKAFGYENFPEYVKAAKSQIRNGSVEVKRDFTLDFLLKYTLENLERDQKPGDDVRQDWDMFLDAMLVEYDRRVNHRVLSKKELETIDDNSFSYAHNIMLIALRSKKRFKDIEEIAQLQGKIFALADLKPELALFTCKIPKGILEEAKIDGEELMNNPNLLDGNEVIRRWMKEELTTGRELYDKLKQKIPNLDFTAKAYLTFLMKGVESKIKKMEKELN